MRESQQPPVVPDLIGALTTVVGGYTPTGYVWDEAFEEKMARAADRVDDGREHR